MNFTIYNSSILISSGDKLVRTTDNLERYELIDIPPPKVPSNLTKGQLEVLTKEQRCVNSIATSHDQKHFAVATENKQVIVYDQAFNVKENFIVSRAANKILFTKSGDVLVADRTGDVYLYKFAGDKSEPVLLLGHLSMILDMVFSECEKFLITCDRDEKIRVSNFPHTYNIESFCLGHKEFVSNLKVTGDFLISASGDGTVRLWSYLKGEQLSVIDTNQYVKDSTLLKQFSSKMDQEKIDVTALPVTDLQIINREHLQVIIGVSLFSLNSLQFYKIDLTNFKWTILNSIDIVDNDYRFLLTNSRLIIFTNLQLIVYNIINDAFCIVNNENKTFEKYKNVLKIENSNSITLLYKRTFDNVQEYLERKKLRLECDK